MARTGEQGTPYSLPNPTCPPDHQHPEEPDEKHVDHEAESGALCHQ